MNHMLEALKKKAMEAKMGQEDPAGPAPYRDHMIETEQAPEEKMEMQDAQNAEGHMQAAEGAMEHLKSMHQDVGGPDDQHQMAILEALSDHSGGGGKLSSMAGDKAKEKMASIMKMKGKK